MKCFKCGEEEQKKEPKSYGEMVTGLEDIILKLGEFYYFYDEKTDVPNLLFTAIKSLNKAVETIDPTKKKPRRRKVHPEETEEKRKEREEYEKGEEDEGVEV